MVISQLSLPQWTSDGEKIEIIRQTVSRDRARRLQDKEVTVGGLGPHTVFLL